MNRKESLFVARMNFADANKMCCVYTKTTKEQCWLWHKSLSHLNFKVINSLVKRDWEMNMPTLEFVQEGAYEACQKEKKK